MGEYKPYILDPKRRKKNNKYWFFEGYDWGTLEFGGGPYDATATAIIPSWEDGASVGNMSNAAIWQEVSGLANPFKAANDGNLFAITDGANAVLLAVSTTDGSNQGTITLGTASVTDMEDVASASVSGQPYIYAADIGDNGNARATFQILRIKEPTITGGDFAVSDADIEIITCQYTGNTGDPQGINAECLIVDPDTGDMYIVTKDPAVPLIYKLAHASSYTGTQDFVYQGAASAVPDWASPQSASGNVVGGCISPDGTVILLKNYYDMYYFPRASGQTIVEALQQSLVKEWSYVGGGQFEGTPTTKYYQHPNYEPQGESVTFDYAGNDYYTASEYQSAWGSTASTYPLIKYAATTALATTYEFQDGVHTGGATDTYLESAAPTVVHGTEVTMIADIGPGTRECLLRFDLSSLAGKTVIGADIVLYINTEGQGWTGHRLLQEGFVEATTNYANYAGGGGVLLNDVIASTTELFNDNATDASLDTYVGFYRMKLNIAELQAMVDGPNYGFAIVATHPSDGEQFDTVQSVTAARRPHLIVRAI